MFHLMVYLAHSLTGSFIDIWSKPDAKPSFFKKETIFVPPLGFGRQNKDQHHRSCEQSCWCWFQVTGWARGLNKKTSDMELLSFGEFCDIHFLSSKCSFYSVEFSNGWLRLSTVHTFSACTAESRAILQAFDLKSSFIKYLNYSLHYYIILSFRCVLDLCLELLLLWYHSQSGSHWCVNVSLWPSWGTMLSFVCVCVSVTETET